SDEASTAGPVSPAAAEASSPRSASVRWFAYSLPTRNRSMTPRYAVDLEALDALITAGVTGSGRTSRWGGREYSAPTQTNAAAVAMARVSSLASWRWLSARATEALFPAARARWKAIMRGVACASGIGVTDATICLVPCTI